METVNVGSHQKVRVPWVALVIILILLLGLVVGFTLLGRSTGGSVLTQTLSEPLGSITTAKVNINPGDGNLMVDRLSSGEPVLFSGALQYLENNGLPTQSINTSNGQANLTLLSSGKGQPWFRLPWAACNGATEWQIHLNPTVSLDLTAHSDGGNVRLNLAGMAITRVAADTGGGNMDVVLPDNAANLSVTAKSGAGNIVVEIGSGLTGNNTVIANTGAGNVVLRLPESTAARIHVTNGVGKATLDTRFNKVDDKTYQTAGYDSAANKIEITATSGAGDVIVNAK